MKKILLICFIISLSSCDIVHLLTIRKKNPENMKESNEFLSKYKIDTTFSYQVYKNCIDSLSIEKYAINTYKLKSGTAASPLQLRMYNNKGVFINGWEMCYGDIKTLGILDSIPFKKVSHLPINQMLSLSGDLSIVNIQNRTLLQQEIEKSDYVILLYWAKCGGWFNRDLIGKTIKYIKTYGKQYSILLIPINTIP